MNNINKVSGGSSCTNTLAQATRSKNTRRKEQNSFFNYIPGREIKDKSTLAREDGIHFYPTESKGSSHLVKWDDIAPLLKKITEQVKYLFGDKWLNKVVVDKTGEEHAKRIQALMECGLTEKEARAIVNYSIQNMERAKNWANDNEKYGGFASTSMYFALALGPIRHLLSGLDFVPDSVKKAVNFAYACSLSLRGVIQYSKRVYNRPDDEAAMNRYQSYIYGNKVAGSLGTSACFMESKVNPLLLPASSLFLEANNPTSFDKLLALATIPNISWWRSRMPAHINQRFLTDLLKFVIHKPLALLHRAKSIEVIKDIKEKKVLNWGYFTQRHYENIGLKDKKTQTFSNFVGELFRNITSSFSKNTDKQIESAKKVGETIAPIFGTLAFVSSIIGIPLKLFCGGLDIKNRFIDLFSSFSLSAQQSIYLFKMVVPALNIAKKTKSELASKETDSKLTKSEKENLVLLYSKVKRLSLLGVITFLASIVNSALKLVKSESQFIEKTKKITENLACDLVALFFSFRRHTLGFQFKAKNPEFYEEDEKEKEETILKDEKKSAQIRHLEPAFQS